VANEFSYNVSVINGATNTVIGTIRVGSGPVGVAFDPSNGYMYVANFKSRTISIILTSAVTSSGMASIEIYAITGIVIALAVTGSAVAIIRKRR
jgi:YVTN family beta-propeller protein